MRRSRRSRRNRAALITVGILVVAAAVGGWHYWPRGKPQTPTGTEPRARPGPAPTIRPAVDTIPQPTTKVAADATLAPGASATRPSTHPAAGDDLLAAASAPSATTRPKPTDDPTAARARDDTRTGNAAIEAARKLYDSGKVVEARHELNALLQKPLRDEEATEVRTLLQRIADETILGPRNVPNDPLVQFHTVQAGDRLIKIAPKYDVPHEAIMAVNNISDAGRIREGQKLKVPRGPFNATIYKSKFRMDVYLQDLYIRSYRVGLGLDDGTPEGGWKVKNRLTNPTYYPPASAPIKHIVPPDDPSNPLGEFWIGLEGVEGNAVGHEGYGIHGTIEPESVGKAVSLGCIRMHNEDVAFLFKLMLPGRSKVTILP